MLSTAKISFYVDILDDNHIARGTSRRRFSLPEPQCCPFALPISPANSLLSWTDKLDIAFATINSELLSLLITLPVLTIRRSLESNNADEVDPGQPSLKKRPRENVWALLCDERDERRTLEVGFEWLEVYEEDPMQAELY